MFTPNAKKLETIQERFEDFHARHPIVYAELVKLARKAKSSGFTEYGIKALAEVVRWQLSVVQKYEGEDFKLNNNFSSRYARLIMEQEPDLDGFFETRELRAV